MKKNRMKNWRLWISLTGNVFLFTLVVIIGCVKTNYISNKIKNLYAIKNEPVNRADYLCIQGWTNTLEKLHLDVDIVFFGNSITYGSCFEKYFPDVSICNLGYPGDDIDGMLFRVGQIKAVNPEQVFVMAGINGLEVQTEQVFSEKYAIMVDSIKRAIPTAKIYLQSILPVNQSMKAGMAFNKEKIAKFNDIIQNISEQKGCVYVNLYRLYAINGIMPKVLTTDGIHLFPKSYDRWAGEIRKYIYEK